MSVGVSAVGAAGAGLAVGAAGGWAAELAVVVPSVAAGAAAVGDVALLVSTAAGAVDAGGATAVVVVEVGAEAVGAAAWSGTGVELVCAKAASVSPLKQASAAASNSWRGLVFIGVKG